MQLIVFSGLPGTGKSSIAEAVGRALGIPVFAKDHLEAVMLRSGIFPKVLLENNLGYIGYDLLGVLAERQLLLGQSAILDCVASFERIRTHWRDLAVKNGAHWRVIECYCSEPMIHRQRLESRKRGIPGWPELQWSDVHRVEDYFEPWTEKRLSLDAVQPLDDNIESALAYLGGDCF